MDIISICLSVHGIKWKIALVRATGYPIVQLMAKKKNPHAVSLGRIGGLKGGKARAAKLTAEQRSEIARKASNARWANQRKAKAKGQ
jgi:hypothetical protein